MPARLHKKFKDHVLKKGFKACHVDPWLAKSCCSLGISGQPNTLDSSGAMPFFTSGLQQLHALENRLLHLLAGHSHEGGAKNRKQRHRAPNLFVCFEVGGCRLRHLELKIVIITIIVIIIRPVIMILQSPMLLLLLLRLLLYGDSQSHGDSGDDAEDDDGDHELYCS